MSGRTRDFRPGRERADERQPPSKMRKQNAYPGPEQHCSDSRGWSDYEENHSDYLSSHGNRYVQQKDARRKSPLGFDRLGYQNKSSHSPSENWDLPPRGKGMSQSQRRSRSQERCVSRSQSGGRAASPIRGRERERSRSPISIHRRLSYTTIDRNGSAMMTSTPPPCKYFAVGMCRKGNQCTFFHADNYENNLEQPRKRGNNRSEHNNRDEAPDFTDNYERGGNRDYDLKRQHPVRSGICKDFASGKCHRDNCRFSHDDPTAEDKRRINHDERMKSWNGPSWDDHNNSKTSDFAKAGDSWGERNRDDPVIADTKDSFGTRESIGWGERSVRNPRCNDGENRADDRRSKYSNEKSKVWDGPTWDDAKDSSNASKVSGRRSKLEDPNPTAGDAQCDDDDIWGRKKNESWHKVKDSSDATIYSNEKSKVWDAPTWDNAKDSSDASKLSGWRTKLEDLNPAAGDERRDDDDIWHRQKNESWYKVKDSSDAAKYSNEKSKVWDGPTWDNNAKDSSDALKVFEWPRKLEDLNPMAADEQRDYDDKWSRQKNESWYTVKNSSGTAKSNSWDGGGGESSVVMNLRIDAKMTQEKKIDNKWDSNLDDKMIQEISPPTVDDTPKLFHDPIAANERGLQKESLQYQSVMQNTTLESGHVQNPRNVVIVEDFDMFNEVKGLGQIEESMSDDSGARLISSSNGHKNVIDLNEAPSQTMTNPEIEAKVPPKENDNKQAETSKQEISASPKVDNKQDKEIAASPKVDNKQEEENINNNNNNTGKEDKAMKVFKIALVELVKEILKPKWKEGQMSRDIHKTIVKKTVDKVSSTISGDQIPNTQDKITHYLSISKPKINKLIQAYVDRLSKTAT